MKTLKVEAVFTQWSTRPSTTSPPIFPRFINQVYNETRWHSAISARASSTEKHARPMVKTAA